MKRKVDLQELRQSFDKVLLRHEPNESGLGGITKAVLIHGTNVYGGNAVCADTDRFNRARGRQIALGRALHAYDVATKNKPSRGRIRSSSYIGHLIANPDPKEKATIVFDMTV